MQAASISSASGECDKFRTVAKRHRRVLSITILISGALNLLHLALPIYSMQVFNRVLPSRSLATLLLLTILLLILIICSMLLDGARSAILSRSSLRSDLAIYEQAVALALKGDPSGHDRLQAADRLRLFRNSSLLTALFDAPWSVAFITAIYFLHPWLGHLTIVSVMVLAGVGTLGPALNRRDRLDAAAAARDIAVEFNTALAQREIVDAMGARVRVQSTIQSLHRKLAIAGIKASEHQCWSDAIARGLRSISQVALLSVAAMLVVNDDMPVGAIVAASMLFARAVSPIERVGGGLISIYEALKARRQLKDDLPLRFLPKSRLPLPPISGLLSAERICVTVPGREKPILGPLSFEVKAGEVITIVGAQGAGKSTLARVVAGASAPSSGKIRLDGTEMLHFDHEILGAQIGYLPEDVQLGAGSIASIIARGQRPDMGEVVKAAMLAGAHGAIQRLSDGYQTIVQPGHSYPSAGERQQIGLARAFYRRPSLVVLDEPTTHLDDSAETDTVRAIKDLVDGGSTVILVSRFAGLLHVTDRVMLLERGTLSLMADQSKLVSLLGPRLATSSANERCEGNSNSTAFSYAN